MGAQGTAEAAPFGLVGHPLGHSWSPQIHAELGSVPYALHDLGPDDVDGFLRSGSWRGLNVTIPYKRVAAAVADERSPRVERLGVANTLVRRQDGSVFAENTDVLGFAWMLDRFCRRHLGGSARDVLAGQEALVLGSGGASQSVRAALEDAGAVPVVVSRRGPEVYEGLADRHPEAALIVNTTPVGMYPSCPATPLEKDVLRAFPRLRGVLDVVYNPERTGICLVAEELSLPCESGLAMLVAQAAEASALFVGREVDEAAIERIERTIRARERNIALIGMPGAGKTRVGRALAAMLGREHIDLDDAFAEHAGMGCDPFIRTRGEEAFRAVETQVLAEVAKRSGLVISCGGGIVTRDGNYPLLHQNSRIVMLDRPLGELSSKGRPVSQRDGIEALAAARMPCYRAWADMIVRSRETADATAQAICAQIG